MKPTGFGKVEVSGDADKQFWWSVPKSKWIVFKRNWKETLKAEITGS